MEKRFLFDRINVKRARIAEDNRSQHTVEIDSHPALAALTRLDQAQLRT
jgi:hypothetical protein